MKRSLLERAQQLGLLQALSVRASMAWTFSLSSTARTAPDIGAIEGARKRFALVFLLHE
jgi:hypothetical protein